MNQNSSLDLKCSTPFYNFVSANSQKIYQKKEHVLLGISPFNSYFSEENIFNLIKWASDNFSRFHVFIPDTLPMYTFLALGYTKEKSIKKAKRQAAYLKNKVNRVFKKMGYSDEFALHLLIDMAFLERNPIYINLKNLCYRLYEKNVIFRDQCNLSTEWVLKGHHAHMDSLDPQLAVHYILHEMPLFCDTPSILDTSSSIFVYHQIPKLLNFLYTNYTDNAFLSSLQGFMEVVFESNMLFKGDVNRDEFRL